MDENRNADIAALKSLFYRPDGDAAATAAAARFGLHRDLPIARFRMVLLPHSQIAFNIFQPALVHLYREAIELFVVVARCSERPGPLLLQL